MSFLEIGGHKLHYQLLGKDEPVVVFLHGLVMDNLSSWFFTMANPVAQSARVLLYDLKGHGFSDRPKAGYSISSHVHDLEQLLNKLEIHSPVILVGNSFGGLLALNFACKHPARVAGLILLDAQLNDAAWKEQMSRSLCLQGEEREKIIQDNFQNWQGRNSRRKSNRLAENARELVEDTSLISDLKLSKDLTEVDLKEIRQPTLAVYGANSDILETGKRLALHMPHCDFRILEGCTHSLLWERTEALRALITEQVAAWTPKAQEGSCLVSSL